MGQVVAIRGLTARLGVKPPRPGKLHRAGKPVYIGVNIYISRRSELAASDRQEKRPPWNPVSVGLASHKAFVPEHSRHGRRVPHPRCRASDALDIMEQVELRLPDLLVRRVRAAA